ncbi:MDR family MFS transporter [Deinococcus ruber]|uniref:MFS transporter n=1 Tax=Deinococcus ruber TaxID=1848197 RepID=A0A918F1J1_9DEIO|nr:MDR family MFS transporter [Deinococcus ruber]GGQ98793.1 MFS transporter [Deinococcus ruber]
MTTRSNTSSVPAPPETAAAPSPAFIPSFTQQEKTITLVALMVVFLLSALDQTIVSTAMPRIIAQLHGLNLYSWVTTAYLLASTVMVPIYGKLGDLFGRKPILVVGVSLFLIGSALCGMAGEPFLGNLFGGGMVQLIVFRAFQGLGGAALFTSAFAILADMYPPAERAKFGGLFGAVFGLASVIGPAIGGFLTDHGTATLLGYHIEGWRWVFYVNLPLGILSLFMILVKMPSLTHKATGKIDFLGAALIILTTVPLLLALTWGGTTYAWGSARIVGLLALSAVSLLLFLWAETRTKDPILPLELFRLPVFALSNLAAFVIGMAFLGVVMFLPLFMQLVLGISATNSGFSLLPLMLGLILASVLSGTLVARTGKYKPFMIGGGLILLLGVWLLTGIGVHTTQLDLAWRMFVVGLGLGPSQSLYNLAVQNAVPRHQMGVATSSSQFFRQIGSTIGTAIFGALLISNLSVQLPKYLPATAHVDTSSINMGSLMGGGKQNSNDQVAAAVNAQYAQIEKAFRGDAAATAAILANPQTPAELKTSLQNGGLKAKVHVQLVNQAAALERALAGGEAGRQALLKTNLPAALKTQLQAIPAAALATPQAAQATAKQASAALLAQEPQAVEAATTQALVQVKSALTTQAAKVARQVEDGTKQAFSHSVTAMFGTSIFIILIGFIITLFIPGLPLRQNAPKDGEAAPVAAH